MLSTTILQQILKFGSTLIQLAEGMVSQKVKLINQNVARQDKWPQQPIYYFLINLYSTGYKEHH